MSHEPGSPRDTHQVARDLQEHLEHHDRLAPALEPDAQILFEKLHKRVFAYCRSVSATREQAEDLTQQTMEVAFRNLPAYRGEARIYQWAIGIARNLRRNAQRRLTELLAADGVLEATDPAMTTLQQLRHEERIRIVREAAARLEPVEQEAVELRYAMELSQQRITEVLELTNPSGARGLLQTCRRKLSRELERLLTQHGHGPSLLRDSSGR